MQIKADGKEYHIEYTFEAAMDKKCVDLCWNYFSGAYLMKGQAVEGLEEGEVPKTVTIDKMIDFMSDVPAMAVYLLYAGLLENHSDRIQSQEDAREIYKVYRKEHPEEAAATFTGLMESIRKQMESDGFFKEIGLEQFLQQMDQAGEKETVRKQPRDHRRKGMDHSGN